MTRKGGKDRRIELFATLLVVLSLFVLASLLSYNPLEEPTISEQVAIRNAMGIAGVYVSHYLIKYTIGYAAGIFPILGLLWGVWMFTRRDFLGIFRLTWYGIWLAFLTAIAVGLGEAPYVVSGFANFTAPGLIGGLAAKVLHDFAGLFGSVVILLGGYFIVISGYLRWEVRAFLIERTKVLEHRITNWLEQRRRGKTVVRPRSYARKQPGASKSTSHRRKAGISETPAFRGDEAARETAAGDADDRAIAIEKRREVNAGDVDAMEERKSRWREYKFPPIELLTDPPEDIQLETRDDLVAKADDLERALATFKVQGKVVRISPGPVITLFEVEPGEGVRVNKFTVLADDLARIMSAERIRIIAPISGTKHIGVEIPNAKPSVVYLRSIISSDDYVASSSPLTVALGKTTTGEAFCFDLAQMPHLLIAGTTGSGKSVAINTLITSMLYRSKPEEVQFVLVDPKKLELSSYRALQDYHLISIPGIGEPIITDPKNAVVALQSALREMDRRYTLFTEQSVRNIDEYRAKARRNPELENIPYIVIIVDELADLMITSGKDVEEPITRLAQMARAVGIHLVIATQRPSVDVITGLIKANFPARIAFQVASKVDSRTILDQMGAEKLLGKGDLLYLPPGKSEPRRLHAAFVSLDEIVGILAHVQEQPKPEEASLPVDPTIGEDGKIAISGESDELFDEAVKLVISQGQASVSMLQRRFRIGYSRAGRLIDELEFAGIISGYSGSKAREVLVDASYLDQLNNPYK